MQRSSPGICPVWLSFSTGKENPLPFTCPLPISTCIFVGHQDHYQAAAGIKGSAETCQSITLSVLRQSALIPSRCGLSDSLLTKPRVGVDAESTGVHFCVRPPGGGPGPGRAGSLKSQPLVPPAAFAERMLLSPPLKLEGG